jgi:phosphate transport system substrate-binding protein
MKRFTTVVALASALAAGASTRAEISGRITVDGSSTVGPFTQAAAEEFMKRHRKVQITVGISGTGGGFERFCRGETDLSDASRPIKSSEHAACLNNNIRWVAFTVANDGISIVVNKANTWVECLTTAQLKKMWEPSSKINSWHDLDAKFPDVKLKLFGPGTDSGTFDFFTEVINGKAKSSRSDYQASENDNVLVQGVEGDRGALGYFGLSYYEENKAKLKLVKVDNGKGCVAPSVRTVQNGTYKPLARPLFIYAKRLSFNRIAVRSFIGYIFNNERAIAKRAAFVPLTDRQLKKGRFQYRQALK